MAEVPFGLAKARIVSHTIREIGDKEAAVIRFEHPCGEVVEALVFMTVKSMNMARAQLKRCGFDPDTQELDELVEKPTLLAGNLVEILVEEYKGKRQAKINLNEALGKTRLKSLSLALRHAKNKNDDDAPPPAGDDIPF